MSAELDELYGVPVEQFIETRERLAKKLKASGDKAGAAELKKAHKPTLAAHALNLLARAARPELEELFAAAKALASGKDFKASLERQRAALEAVRKKVKGDDGPAILQVVQGAAVDAALSEAVLKGCFSKLPEAPIGFFGAAPEGAPPVVVPPPQKSAPRAPPPAPLPSPPKPKVDPALERELKAAEKEAARAAAELEELERELVEAKRQAHEAKEKLEKLRKRVSA